MFIATLHCLISAHVLPLYAEYTCLAAFTTIMMIACDAAPFVPYEPSVESVLRLPHDRGT